MMLSALNALVEHLESAVPNVGSLHAYERYAKASKDLKAIYGDNLIGGFFRVKSGSKLSGNSIAGIRKRVIELVLIKAWSDKDASQIEFNALLESIEDVLASWKGESGTQLTEINDGVVVVLTQNRSVMYCNVLCHMAHLEFMLIQ